MYGEPACIPPCAARMRNPTYTATGEERRRGMRQRRARSTPGAMSTRNPTPSAPPLGAVFGTVARPIALRGVTSPRYVSDEGSEGMEAAAVRAMGLVRALGLRAAIIAVTVAVAALTAPPAVMAAGDANQPTCPFETEASPGFRTYLPDCRAYELVTPPFKGGGVVLTEGAAVSPDGAHIIIGAGGVFAGAGNFWANENRNPNLVAYELARGGSGWVPAALTPAATSYPYGAIMAVSAQDFGTTLWGLATNTRIFSEDIFLRKGAGEFLPVGPGLGPAVATEGVPRAPEELNFV